MFNKPHILKVWPELFKQLWIGEKAFEYRRNDRNFYEGDILWLREYQPSLRNEKEPYTGRYLEAIVEKIWGEGWSEIPELPETHVIMKIRIYQWHRTNWRTDNEP